MFKQVAAWLARRRDEEFAQGQAWARAHIAKGGRSAAIDALDPDPVIGPLRGPFAEGARSELGVDLYGIALDEPMVDKQDSSSAVASGRAAVGGRG